jgi:hypothetical protein
MWGSNEEKKEFAQLYPFFYGQREERNYRKLFKEVDELVRKQYAPALCTVGIMYATEGYGVHRDFKEAFRLFMESASQEYPSAEFGVGNFYMTAFPRHDACEYRETKATYWYTKAAEHGNPGAQYNLAFSYQKGRGVTCDPVAAYVWASLAIHCSTIRFRPAEVVRDQTIQELNQKQLSEAQNRIEQMQAILPYEWSEHMVYWKSLAGQFRTIEQL